MKTEVKLLADWSDNPKHPKNGATLRVIDVERDEQGHIDSVVALWPTDGELYRLYPYEYEEVL